MSTKFLGEQIDIHTGGEDNIFPHHESEIAQSECASGKPFVRYWLHRRRIDMGAEKMSKSLGNVLTIPDITEQGFSPLDLRYYFLSVHYRTHLKFTWKGLEDAHKARRKILEWMQEVTEWTSGDTGVSVEDVLARQEKFSNAMNSDLNTSGALAVVFDLMSWSRNQQQWSTPALESLFDTVNVIRQTFGCFEPESPLDVPGDVQELLDQREQARSSGDFETSDRLRAEIRKKGYEVRDLPEGQRVERL